MSMDYESLLERGGDNGLFQIVVFFALAFACLNSGAEISTMVIALHTPNYACVNQEFSNQPENYNFSSYVKEFGSNSTCTMESSNGTVACTKWIFDDSEIGDTLVTDLNLVCSKSGYQAHVYTAFFGGLIIGMGLNALGDNIGRRKFILICCVWETAFNIAMALVPGFFPQLVLRFFRSFASAIYLQCIGLLAELITIRRRGVYLNSYWIFWCIGTISGSIYAYIGYDWQYIKLISIVPSVAYISYYWVIPESPRWLLLNGKRKEAEDVLKMMCRWNRIPWDEKTMNDFKIHKHATGRIQDLFRLPNTRRKVLIMSFVQWSFCLCYYGLTSDPRLFSKNIYLGLFLQGLVEIPTSIFAVILSKRFGRKPPTIVLIALTTVFLVAVPFIRNAGFENSATVTALLGKVFMVTGFIIIDCINSEIHPTCVRALGMTVTNLVGNTGNLFAAYINQLRYIAYFIPPVIYSIQVAICGVLIYIFIPEMSRCPLPQTVEEAEELYPHQEERWIKWMKERAQLGEELLPRTVITKIDIERI